MGENEDLRCMLCGGDEFMVSFTDGGIPEETAAIIIEQDQSEEPDTCISIVKCVRCGLSFRQRPRYNSIQSFINTSFTLGITPRSLTICSDLSTPEFMTTHNTGQEEIEEIGQFTQPPGSLLNIDNDSTDILETARVFGWRSEAVDSLDPAGLDQRENCANTEISDGKYDVIRMANTLERADNPIQYLKQIRGSLQESGLLVISTPDCSSWDFPLHGQGASLQPVDLPLWFFTSATLTQLLERSGFTILKVATFTYRVPLTYDASEDESLLNMIEFHPSADSSAISPYPDPKFLRIFARRSEKQISEAAALKESASLPIESLELTESF